VRDLIREALAREQLEERIRRSGCLGVLTYLYNHHERELSKRLTETHHAHHDLTVTTLHMHLDHDHCLEAVLLKGPASQVERLSATRSWPGLGSATAGCIAFPLTPGRPTGMRTTTTTRTETLRCARAAGTGPAALTQAPRAMPAQIRPSATIAWATRWKPAMFAPVT
jgi:hypothetical protein